MADRIFRGDAQPVAQVVKITPATVEIGDTFAIAINGKAVSYAATDEDGTSDVALISNVVSGLVALWNAATFPEATEVAAEAVDSDEDNLFDYLTLTADEAGVPFEVSISTENNGAGNVTVETTAAGVSPQNERQKIELAGTYSGGTFTISWDPGGGTETTGAIAYNASAAAIQSALESLATPGVGDFLVTGAGGGPWYVTFQGSYAETDVNPMSVDGSNLTGAGDSMSIETVAEGRPPAPEIQSLSIYQEGESGNPIGSYTLSFDGETTGAIAYNASAAAIQSALESLATIGSGNVLVSGGQGVADSSGGFPETNDNYYFAILFVGDLAGTNVSQLLADGSNLFNAMASAGGGVFTAPVGEELQHVDLDTPTGGSFTLTYDGQTTTPLGYDANRNEIEAALETLPNITNVVVRGHPGQFVVHFSGDTGSDVSELVLNSFLTGAGSETVATLAHGTSTVAGTNEAQSVKVFAQGGTFTLSFDGETTSALNYDASAASVESALEALSNITNVTVSGSGTNADPWVVIFNDPGSENFALMAGDGSNLTGGGADVTMVVGAVVGVNETQEISLDVGVSGGSFRLTYDGVTTAAIPYSASAATVESALEALDTIDGVSVSGSGGGPWTVEFDGDTLVAQNVDLLVGDGAELIGGAGTETLTETTIIRSKGPHHLDDPDNWTGFRVPDSLDTLYFATGSVPCLYGTKLQTTFEADAGTDVLTLDGGAGADFVVDQIVRVMNLGGGLPGGLSAATDYYVKTVDYDAGSITLSATSGGSVVNISSAGTGKHSIAVKLTALHIHSRWSNAFLGLNELNENEYYEYRNRSLAIAADTITVGAGDGDGSPLMDIDTGPWQTAITLIKTGGSQESGLPAFRWKGSHAENTAELIDGEFGASVYATETSVLASFIQRAGFAMIQNCTLGSIDKTGGELLADEVTLAGAVNIRG